MELAKYTRSEEIFNTTSHIVGCAISIAMIVLGVVKAAFTGDAFYVVSFALYGSSVFIMFCISSIYHGLKPCLGKKVMRVIDHCDIYFCIAGTYTPILLCGIRPFNPVLAWTIFGIEWGIALIAACLVAINMKKFFKISIAIYIIQGWCLIVAIPATITAMGVEGFALLLSGGIAFTIGAVIYVVSKKKNVKFGHSIFHIFVVVGIVLQFLSILFYV
ncbi:MAG: hemolysin III family protein [Coriobacteriia bacterium]|nr:hemolysin III family protein [Coriobacteriia bacterium]